MDTVSSAKTHQTGNPETPGSEYFANTRREMRQFVPRKAKVILDCGCGEGMFGALLKQDLGAEVWGIEIHANAAEKARKVLDRVLVGDLSAQIEDTPDRYFNCIVFNDVLEHLIDPWAVLTAARDKLAPGGVVVCSVPNIRFLRVLRDYVLRGEWHYEDYGICDRTHLHCFTEKSLRKMFEELGYDVQQISGINPITTWKFAVLNALTFGRLADTRYLQFACVAKPK